MSKTKNKPAQEIRIVRKKSRKQKRVGRGDGFCLDDLARERNSPLEREARKFEKRYGKFN